MSNKDILTIIVSCLALLASGLTAYFNIIRRYDDVRVVTSLAPFVFVDSNGKLEVSGQQQMTFINSGNREAAVTGMTLVLFKLKTAPSNDSRCDEASHFQVANLAYDFDPFIVKPGDIVIKQFEQPQFPQIWEASGNDAHMKIYSLGTSIFEKGDTVFMCLRLSVTTPDAVADRVFVPKHYITIKDIPHEGSVASSVSSLIDSNKPYTVVRKTGTVLSD